MGIGGNFNNNQERMTVEPTLVILLQAGLAIIMLFFGFILNGMRVSVEKVSSDLKTLNDAVLGRYLTRDDSDGRWRDQRTLDHELRSMIQKVMLDVAKISGKEYVGPE
jgi:hypothetical protein